MKPNQFDVVLTGNLYGNIIANVGSGLCGGPGITPGGNVGTNIAIYESVSQVHKINNEKLVGSSSCRTVDCG
jgi:isocitrate dehydrogenase (NAD+)